MRYEIIGDNLPVLKLELNKGEKIITEAGAMSWMTPTIQMGTTSKGGVGKAFGRLFSGESLFLNEFTCKGESGGLALASAFPGTILPVRVTSYGGIIAQKSAFIACEENVELSTHIQKKIGVGFFGGEGFIMQKLSGDGLAFLEIDGHCEIVDLNQGEEIIVGTGHLAAMDESCKMDIIGVEGFKNVFFGGEGLFLTKVTGPGKVYLQGMPIQGIAKVIAQNTITTN